MILKEHHFHKTKGEKGDAIKSADGKVLFDVGTGAECVQCHMPGRTYMGIHYRLDHSLRTPRPDLSVKIGTPNACNRCHIDKTAQWSVDAITKWYGPGRRPHYGTVIDAGRKRFPEAKKNLILLAADPLYPVIVRSTALSLLTAYPGGGHCSIIRAGPDGRRSPDPSNRSPEHLSFRSKKADRAHCVTPLRPGCSRAHGSGEYDRRRAFQKTEP